MVGGYEEVILDGLGGASAGGGIAMAAGSGSATFANCTIAGNSSSGGFGGGYWIYGSFNGVPQPPRSSPDYQAATSGGGLEAASGTVTLYNTIVALNSTDVGLGAGTVSTSSAFNLIGTGGSGGLINGINGNQVGVSNPGIGSLTNNGGPTQTIGLLTGSPAIDAGSTALAVDPTTGQPLTTDQRGAGFDRIFGGSVDIGAYEVQSEITGDVTIGWGTKGSVGLQTASDGLRLLPAGRNTDLPWQGIKSVQINLSQAAALSAGDITVHGARVADYGPVTLSGSGTSYTITFAQPIMQADQVTITIGNMLIAPFTRRLDVLPGDVNDDGVVNVQDMVAIRNQMFGILGAVPTIFGDINGDGKVDILDYTAVRKLIGTHW